MTVPYTSIIATTSYSTFARLLFIWKGSVYRLILVELAVFVGAYTTLSLTYRFLLSGILKKYFEEACIFCNKYNDSIPVVFVLGFYVALVVGRWWEQFQALPWPDEIALYLTAYCHGNGERPTRIRRTIMRYMNLSYCLALRAVSSRARMRFPTEEHLVSSGLMTQEELELIQAQGDNPYYTPVVWALDTITRARREGLIHFDRAVEILSEAALTFRGKLGTIFGYDWINIPLVYTQTATITVYSYFISCLFAWQFLDPSAKYPGYEIDIYVPVFGFLRFFFYMGWLKVAESLINPFGTDLDDFEIEYLIERNLNISYKIVDDLHHDHPELVSDAYWNEEEVALSKEESAQGQKDAFIGSLAILELGDSKQGVHRRSSAVLPSETSRRMSQL